MLAIWSAAGWLELNCHPGFVNYVLSHEASPASLTTLFTVSRLSVGKVANNPRVSLPDKAGEGHTGWVENTQERDIRSEYLCLKYNWTPENSALSIVSIRVCGVWGWGRGADINHSKIFKACCLVRVREGQCLSLIMEPVNIFPPVFNSFHTAMCPPTVMARLRLHNRSRPR